MNRKFVTRASAAVLVAASLMVVTAQTAYPQNAQDAPGQGRSVHEESVKKIMSKIDSYRKEDEAKGRKVVSADERTVRTKLLDARPFIYSVYIENSNPRRGEPVTIGVRVRNSGDSYAYPLVATIFFGAFFEIDPRSGGSAIDEQIVRLNHQLLQSAVAGRQADLPCLSSEEFRVEPGDGQEVAKEFKFNVNPTVADQPYLFHAILWNSGSRNQGYIDRMSSSISVRN